MNYEIMLSLPIEDDNVSRTNYISKKISKALSCPEKNKLNKYKYEDYYFYSGIIQVETFRNPDRELSISFQLELHDNVIEKQKEFFSQLYTICVECAERANFHSMSFFAYAHSNFNEENYYFMSENSKQFTDIKKYQLIDFSLVKLPLHKKLADWKTIHPNSFPFYFQTEQDEKIKELCRFFKVRSYEELIKLKDNDKQLFDVLVHNIFVVKKDKNETS